MMYLHTMIRVTDLEKSLRFYTHGLGFVEVRREDHADEKFSLVFLRADGDSGSGPMIELTHNWDVKSYARGEGYGHVAYRVDSVADVRRRLQENGFDLSWGPGKTPSGKTVMAFVDDPDGYEIELLEG